MKLMKIQTLIVLLMAVLTACAGPTPVVVVPTLASLPTVTQTEVFTPTALSSETAPPTQTESPLPTETLPTLTSSATATTTLTPSPMLTDTPLPTETPAFTPSLTITNTVTPTITLTRTPTQELPLLGGLAALAANVTVLPPEIRYGTATLTAMAQLYAAAAPTSANGLPVAGSTPTAVALGTYVLATLPPPIQTVNCQYPPPGNLNNYFINDPSLASQMGCPVGAPPTPVQTSAAWQPFERGFMFYVQGSPSSIYVLSNDGRFRRFDDTFISGVDPESGGETPPAGLFEPVRGFGKVWRSNPDVRALLGWATQGESGDSAMLQPFERGRAIYLASSGQTYFLFDDVGVFGSGSWRMVIGGF